MIAIYTDPLWMVLAIARVFLLCQHEPILLALAGLLSLWRMHRVARRPHFAPLDRARLMQAIEGPKRGSHAI